MTRSWQTHEDRHRHQDVIDPVIAEWTRGQTPEEAMRKLQEHGISAGAVMTQADAFADPHIQSREFFHEASQEDCGTQPISRPVVSNVGNAAGHPSGSGDVRAGQRVTSTGNCWVIPRQSTRSLKQRGTSERTTRPESVDRRASLPSAWQRTGTQPRPLQIPWPVLG